MVRDYASAPTARNGKCSMPNMKRNNQNSSFREAESGGGLDSGKGTIVCIMTSRDGRTALHPGVHASRTSETKINHQRRMPVPNPDYWPAKQRI